jgi:DNA (cytosine-5)-methyltransferase 1
MENVPQVIGTKNIKDFQDWELFLESLGYSNYVEILNAKDYGIPQNRERVFTVSIRKDQYYKQGSYWFPQKQELKLRLKDMLEDEVDKKYYLSDKMIKYISADNEKWTGNNDKSLINKKIASAINTGEGSRRCDASNYISDIIEENYNIKGLSYIRNFGSKGKIQDKEYCDTLTASMGTGGGNIPILKIKNATKQGYTEAIDGDSVNLEYPNSETRRGRVGKQVSQTLQCNDLMGVVNNLRIRKLTPKECWRLMGFDDEDFNKASKVNSNSQLYKQAGNSIVVNVLENILKNLL